MVRFGVGSVREMRREGGGAGIQKEHEEFL